MVDKCEIVKKCGRNSLVVKNRGATGGETLEKQNAYHLTEGKSMTAKGTAQHIIDALPNRVSMDDVMHALYVASKFDRGEREIRAGKGISDDEARKRLKKWQR